MRACSHSGGPLQNESQFLPKNSSVIQFYACSNFNNFSCLFQGVDGGLTFVRHCQTFTSSQPTRARTTNLQHGKSHAPRTTTTPALTTFAAGPQVFPYQEEASTQGAPKPPNPAVVPHEDGQQDPLQQQASPLAPHQARFLSWAMSLF